MLSVIIYILSAIVIFYLFYKAVAALARLRQERKYINSLFL